MKVLVTGSTGMLGKELINVLKDEYEVKGVSSKDFDIRNLNETIEGIKEFNPEVVIHTAAFTDVDGSEHKKDLAYKVNSIGTRNVAVACNITNSSLLYISTDYVFDGKKGSPYYEYDKPNPINVYGKTKYLGEVYVRDLLNKFYIVRTSWLYGPYGSNFVDTMLQLAENKDEIKVVDDQVGSPTYTLDLSLAIKKLIKEPRYGIYHLTNSGHCSWYEFAKQIFKEMNLDVKLTPIKTEESGRPAKRPKFSVLKNYNWEVEGFKKLRHYKDALKNYLRRIRT